MDQQDHASQKTLGGIPLREVQKTRVPKIYNYNNKASELDFIEEFSVKDSC